MISKYREYFVKNLALAYPIIFSQTGHMITSISDNIMVGRAGSVFLAASSFANGVYIVFMFFCIGLMSSITPLAGNASGGKDDKMLTSLFSNGFVVALLSGIFVYVLLLLLPPLFPYLHQPQDVIREATPYYYLIALSVIPMTLFLHLKHFSEGLSLTKPAMIVSLASNILNIFLNYVLIYGKFGFPAMELVGAGLATLISRILMFVAMLFVVLKDKRTSKYFLLSKLKKIDIKLTRVILRTGIPISLQSVLEVAIFSAGSLLIGTFGANALAAHQIVLNASSMTYMVALGFASSATIHISRLKGEDKYSEIPVAAYSALILVSIFMLLSAIIFILFGEYIALVYVNEKEVITVAIQLFIVAALFQFSDGVQVVLQGALRGLLDVKKPTYIVLFSYWGIGFPVCYAVSTLFGVGPTGVWYGYLAGLSTASLLLLYRFRRKAPHK